MTIDTSSVDELASELDDVSIDFGMRLLSLTNQYVPELYDLRLNINHLKPNFNGNITIEISKNKEYNGSFDIFQFTLHACKIIVTKAVLEDGNKMVNLKTHYDRANQRVSFTADSEHQWHSPEKAKVRLEYMGQINSIKTYTDSTRGLFKTNYSDTISGKSNNYILATHTQPHFCRMIFPLVDELHVKVPIKLTIVTLNKFQVISNSTLAENPKPVPMSEDAVFEFKPTPPIASSIFGFVVGDLEYLENTDSGIPVRVYAPIGNLAECSYPLFIASKLLPILKNLLNFDYPLEKLDFIGLPFLSDGAMENWGLVTVISSQLLVDEGSSKESKRQLRQLIAHELVHQWIGNLVSFDDWRDLWLNESFATWLGNYLNYVAQLDKDDYENNIFEISQLDATEALMDEDCFYDVDSNLSLLPSIHQITSNLKYNLESTTQTLFDKTSYDKGIILLTMIGKLFQNEVPSKDNNSKIDYSIILKGITKVIESFKYKNIKPFDIWNVLNEYTNIDLLSFVHSWTRYSGFPLVTVNATKDKLQIEQHKYIFNSSATELKMEDQPYHVPLSIKLLDDKNNIKILNLMLTDRFLEVPIPTNQLIKLNNNQTGYYKVIYNKDVMAQICNNIVNNHFSVQDTISVINDYGKLLGQTGSTSDHLIAIFSIFNCFINPQWRTNYHVLKVGLDYLETINNILLHFTEYELFRKWLDTYIVKVFNKIGNWEKLYKLSKDYSPVEMTARNLVLHIGLNNISFQEVSRKLFRNLINPMNKSYIPKEILPSVFNLTIIKATQKEYKQILQLVKNANSSISNNSNLSVEDLQTIAVSSLSFVENEGLLSKSLNFVMTNIDSKLIELALLGFQFKRNKNDILKLWVWYKLHYDQWILRSLTKGSDLSKQLGITMKNISKLVLGDLMQYHDDLILKRDQFINEKLQKLPDHGLKDLVERIQEENMDKKIIGEFYDDLIKILP